MEKQLPRQRMRVLLAVAAVITSAVLARRALFALSAQLTGGFAMMALSLPLCRRLERRLPPGLSAALALSTMIVLVLALVLMLFPPLIRQLGQVASAFPDIMTRAEGWLTRGQALLSSRGIDLTALRDEMISTLSSRIGKIVSMAAGLATQTAQALGKMALAPLIGFYLLRDRRKIAALVMLLLPVRYRAQAVRAAREMRRETSGFLRGQLLVSAAVAIMTAVGLALVGTPGYLALGMLMGILELVPYIGPLLAGIPAVLLALPGGLWQAVWTLAVILAVQQIEGSFLSPRLMSGATRLHPLLVLLAVSAGGIFSGAIGMVLALPIVVSIRGALRGLRQPQL